MYAGAHFGLFWFILVYFGYILVISVLIPKFAIIGSRRLVSAGARFVDEFRSHRR